MESMKVRDQLDARVIRNASEGDSAEAHGKYHFVCRGPDGKIKWEANYENNVPSGTGKSYSPDGVLIQETTYSNNGKDQSKKIYYKDGSLFQEVQSVGGRLTGDWKVYHPNGRLAHVKSYDQDGVKISEQYFDEQGKVVIDGLWQGHNQKGEITGPFRLKNGVREDGF